MKIISKYKDYYDFLKGVYGEDPKLILDRREGIVPPSSPSVGKYTLYICGRKIETYWDGNRFWYGKDLENFAEKPRYTWHKPKEYECVYIPSKKLYSDREFSSEWYATEILKDEKNLNIKNNCPILTASGWNDDIITEFPQLSFYNLGSYIPPEEIYQWLVTWLAQRVDESQQRQDNLTDVQKLENKGFDKKTSFRPNIKTE